MSSRISGKFRIFQYKHFNTCHGVGFHTIKIDGQVQSQKVKPMIDEATLQHFILGMMMAMSYPTFRRFKYPYLALIFIHPFVIEGVQIFMPERTPDVADIMVGLVGTLLGFCLV